VSAPCQVDGPAATVESLLEHYDSVQGAIRSRAGCPELAADVMQEAFLKLLTAPPPGVVIRHPGRYLRQVAGRLLIDRIRAERSRCSHRRQQLPPTLAAATPEPCELVGRREQLRAIGRALARLSPRCREVFVRRCLDGQGYDAIAAALGIAPSTIEKHMIKARLALRRCLQRLEADR